MLKQPTGTRLELQHPALRRFSMERISRTLPGAAARPVDVIQVDGTM
jgi:hypothetical protein